MPDNYGYDESDDPHYRTQRPSFNPSDMVEFRIGKKKHVGEIMRVVLSKKPVYEIETLDGLPWLIAEEKLRSVDA